MKTKKKTAAAPAEPLPDDAGAKAKKEKKPVFLKHFFVSEGFEPGEAPRKRKAAFILHTCAVNARKEFEERTGAKAGSCCVAAESDLTKNDMPKHDFWKERRNWTEEIDPPVESESQKRYFEMKARAERVQAAKRAAGIREWDQATEEQLAKVSEILKEEEKKA